MKPVDENIFGKATGYAIYLEWEVEARDNSDVLDIAPQVGNIDLTNLILIPHILVPILLQLHLHPCTQDKP